jgi:hypothetical protein
MTDQPMPDEPDELSPPDAEELASAAALARALDGGRAEPELPEDALQTAALLRASAAGARLGEHRQRELRNELLAALPAPARPRPRWASWFFPVLSLASATAAYLLMSRGEPAQPVSADGATARSDRREAVAAAHEHGASAPAEPSEPGAPRVAASRAAASRSAGQPATAAARRSLAESERSPAAPLADGSRQTLTRDIGRDASELRRELLARADDGSRARAYAQLDAARSRPAIERSQRTLVELSDALEGRTDDEGRLIRQDLYCRLAETALRLGEPQTALEWARRGLALDGQPTPLLAQLEALGGDAWTALGDDEQAARSYMRALRMHETLLGEDLDGR